MILKKLINEIVKSIFGAVIVFLAVASSKNISVAIFPTGLLLVQLLNQSLITAEVYKASEQVTKWSLVGVACSLIVNYYICVFLKINFQFAFFNWHPENLYSIDGAIKAVLAGVCVGMCVKIYRKGFKLFSMLPILLIPSTGLYHSVAMVCCSSINFCEYLYILIFNAVGIISTQKLVE